MHPSTVEKPLETVTARTRVPFSELMPFPRSHGMRNFIFSFLLLGALASGPWLWLARIAWMLLPLFFLVDFSYSLYALFFFAAFFHPTGFLPDFPFSTKHFHMALLLTAAVQIIQNQFLITLASALRRGRTFFPLLGIALIAFTRSLYRWAPSSEIMTTFNFLSILGAFLYLSSLVRHSEQLLYRGILFFAAGVCIQVFIGFYNLRTDSFAFGIHSILHNNHLGILCALTFFYPLAFAAGELHPQRRLGAWILVWILFSGMFFSCSRTAWLSFLFSAMLFGIFFRTLPPGQFKQKFVRDCLWMGVALVLTASLGIAGVYKIYYQIYWRFRELPRLWDGWFWNYTLQDHQNFGFFGIHRLDQLRQIKIIVKDSPLFGIGFVQQAVDFHSLYLTILGVSGLIGLGLFIFFCVKIMLRLHRAIRASVEIPSTLMQIAAFCAVTAWLLMGFMETLILQYPIWIHAMFAVLLGQFSTSGLAGGRRSARG